jgi:hypothetical protein
MDPEIRCVCCGSRYTGGGNMRILFRPYETVIPALILLAGWY